jgi:hypothetical protein
MGHLDGSGRKESDGYKKENTNRRSISDHTERGLRASKGSRMTSRGSLPFFGTSQAQQAWGNNMAQASCSIRISLSFLHHPPHPSKARGNSK